MTINEHAYVGLPHVIFFNSVAYTGLPITWYAIGNRTFYGGFLIDARYVKVRNTFFRRCFLSISEKYLGFVGDHSVVDCFELKHAIFVKSCAKSATVIGQESNLCQYMFMLKANCLINQSKLKRRQRSGIDTIKHYTWHRIPIGKWQLHI